MLPKNGIYLSLKSAKLKEQEGGSSEKSMNIIKCLWVLQLWLCSQHALASLAPRPQVEGLSLMDLSGPWEFYWKKLLRPEDPLPPPDAVVESQLLFDEIQLKDGSFASAYGYASYHMQLKSLPPSPQGYTLLTSPRGAEHIFIYETESKRILFERELGQVRAEFDTPSRRKYLAHFHIDHPTDVSILIQTSNSVFYTGGLWGPPRLSNDFSLSHWFHWGTFRDLICFGMILTVILTNGLIWLQNPMAHKSNLYLVLACLGVNLRLLPTSDIFTNVIPLSLSSWLYRSELMALPICSVVCLYLDETFPISKRFRVGVFVHLRIGLVLAFCCMVLPLANLAKFLPVLQFHNLLSLLLALFISLYASVHRIEGHGLNVLGILLIIGVGIYDIYWVANWRLSDIYLIQVAFAIYLALQAQVLAKRFARDRNLAVSLMEENASYQKALRIESEARMEMASKAAHHLNNPLNYIQGGIAELGYHLKKLAMGIDELLGTGPTQDEQLLECRTRFNQMLREFEDPLARAEKGVQKASVTIKHIRGMSGVDGFGCDYFPLRDFWHEFRLHFQEFLEPSLSKRMHFVDPHFSAEDRILSNRNVLIHILQDLSTKVLMSSPDHFEVSVQKEEVKQGLLMRFQCAGLMESESISLLQENYSHICKPFRTSCQIEERETSIEIRLYPAQEAFSA